MHKAHSALTFRWGCQHEDEAVRCYTDSAQKNHDGLEVSKAGFVIDVDRPYIGASPDRLLNCKCCGKGVLEVKCPFCHKSELPEEEDNNFCMTKESGQWRLRREHAYYYQVQLQMHVCKVSYADFIVWTESEYVVERIAANDEFITSKMEAVTRFFTYGILPEIIGKWYSRKPVADGEGLVQEPSANGEETTNDVNEDDESTPWCYCNEPSSGEMIFCDNRGCTIKWFHFKCLRIQHAPKGKWYCPSCRNLPRFNKQKQRK